MTVPAGCKEGIHCWPSGRHGEAQGTVLDHVTCCWCHAIVRPAIDLAERCQKGPKGTHNWTRIAHHLVCDWCTALKVAP